MISGVFIIYGTETSLFWVTQSCYALTDTLIDWIYQPNIMVVVRQAYPIASENMLPKVKSKRKTR